MNFRLDRFLTLYLFGPLSRLRKPKGLRIPILMYHSISDGRENRHPYYWINTSPARFAEHMKYLHDNNYQVIPLAEAVEMIRSQNRGGPASQWPSQPVDGANCQVATDNRQPETALCSSHRQPSTGNREPSAPTRCVVLTFDDGYLDFYTQAFPVLRRYGFTATVFLPTAYIDGKRPGIRGKEHLNWDQVRELHSAGVDFGSHTVNHPQLYDLGWPDIEYELRVSKEAIESQLNSFPSACVNRQLKSGNGSFAFPTPNTQHPTPDPFGRQPSTVNRQPFSISSFCYPYKYPEQDRAFASELHSVLGRQGYLIGTGTRLGSANTNGEMLSLKRLPISSGDDLGFLSAKIAGGYDWLSLIQSSAKVLKKLSTNHSKSTTQSANESTIIQSAATRDTRHPTPDSSDRQPSVASCQSGFSSNQPRTEPTFAKGVRYVIITPVRDEEEYLRFTIDSVINQTVLPIEWVIVDDGSTDRTGEIIDRAAVNYHWIRSVHRDNRGFRKAGGGVVETFYEGYRAMSVNDWEFIVKLDGDLSFQSDYFERCFEIFLKNPQLGVGGGDIYNLIDGRLELEKQPRFHVRGATKIYKRDSWEAIGGLIAAPGWDTLDEVKANMLGWISESFPALKVTHYRVTGAADGSRRDAVKNGLSDYICGYHPAFMIIKYLKRLFQKPYIIGSMGLFYGYISGYLKNVRQVDDKTLIAYLRRQQLQRLLGRKSIWQ